MEVHGGGNFRAIVAWYPENMGGVTVLQHLQDSDPQPTQDQLDSMAAGLNTTDANDGVFIRVSVVGEMRPGPLWNVLDPVTYMGLAGLNDSGTIGPSPETVQERNSDSVGEFGITQVPTG